MFELTLNLTSAIKHADVAIFGVRITTCSITAQNCPQPIEHKVFKTLLYYMKLGYIGVEIKYDDIMFVA